MAMDRPTPSESGEAWASGDVASGWLWGVGAQRGLNVIDAPGGEPVTCSRTAPAPPTDSCR